MEKRNAILRLTESGIMIALATVLSIITVFQMPQGGSITPLSMLPIILIAYRYGPKWGLLVGFTFGLLQLLLGFNNLSFVTGFNSVVAIILLDYLVAFGVLGLAGIFKNIIKRQYLSVLCGSLLVIILRFICHFISGITIWRAFVPEGKGAVIYSLSYNASYMIPEGIAIIVVLMILSLSIDLSKTGLKLNKDL